MRSVDYRGYRLKYLPTRRGNKWYLRLLGEDEPRRYRTKADAMRGVDRIEEIKHLDKNGESSV